MKNEEISTKVVAEESKNEKKVKKINVRVLAVILFVIIFMLSIGISLRANYLEHLELGEQYLTILNTNLAYLSTIIIGVFLSLYLIIYMTNKSIQKSLKHFFDAEKKQMPKILNKSIALVSSAILSVIIGNMISEQVMLAFNATSFGITDPVFNLDISYFMFIKPLLETVTWMGVVLYIGLSVYMLVYHIIVFNKYFDGIESKMLWESILAKKIFRNLKIITVGIAGLVLLGIQNMVYGKIMNIGDSLELVGAGLTTTTIQLWGYVIFSILIIISVFRAIRLFKKKETMKVIKSLITIPVYLVGLFVIMIVFDLIYLSTNELDKQKAYIEKNIDNTKNAYDINITENTLGYSGTITQQIVDDNLNIINNIPVISEELVLNTLKDTQTETGQFSYRNVSLAKYEINGQTQVVYTAPREIASSNRTYNNRTYEYTHGMGEIIVSATESDETGNAKYIQKEISGEDEQINIEQPRIYFGMETNEIVITNTEINQEYDYTDENGVDHMSNYAGDAGLELNVLDRLILGLSKGNFDLAFSTDITADSKILLNTQILERAKIALPYLMYDTEPYTVITDDGSIVWVIDAYTTSSSYPYAQYSRIEYENTTHNINYIRNSVKVIVDAYDGTMSYYITDRTDPIAMAYRNIYPELFVDLDEEIPQDIQEHIVYPELLYNIQADILKVYHNVKADVLYREDDIWDIVKHNNTNTANSIGVDLESQYAIVETEYGEELGLIQLYTKDGKQNIISYLVGTVNGTENQLVINKFSEDSNILSPIQLNNQIAEDETISAELDLLNQSGTKITKEMLIVPIDNTLIYIEPIYQTMLNESDIPVLKKVIVASGNKVAIGDNLAEALQSLLSTEAVDLEIENTDDIDGLIDAIIKANNNLEESTSNNDWDLMGQDIERLQELIESLEQLQIDLEKEENNTDVLETDTVVDSTDNQDENNTSSFN